MNRQSLWIVPALALALAAPAVADDDKDKEKNQNRARREQIYGYDDYRGDAYGRTNGNMRFRGMDRNGDGRITRREWSGNDKSFRMHDANRDGVLSGREVWAGNNRSDNIYRNGTYRDDIYRNDTYRNDTYRNDGRVASFGSLDRNRNGVVEGREWPYSASVFNQLDRNNNRVIETWEYRLQ